MNPNDTRLDFANYNIIVANKVKYVKSIRVVQARLAENLFRGLLSGACTAKMEA